MELVLTEETILMLTELINQSQEQSSAEILEHLTAINQNTTIMVGYLNVIYIFLMIFIIWGVAKAIYRYLNWYTVY